MVVSYIKLILFKESFDDVAQPEGRAAVDTVVNGFPGVGEQAHALPAVAWYKGTVDGTLGTPRGAGADTPLDGWFSHSEFHRHSSMDDYYYTAKVMVIS